MGRAKWAALRAGRDEPRPVRAPEPSLKREWWVAGGVAALIALGPVATIVGANWIAGGARAEARQLEAKAAPRIAAAKAAASDRETLAGVLRRPTLGLVIEALARGLPPEASLVRAERGRDGLLEIEINTPDPDRLRTALRREPSLATLHDTGQRQSEAAMVVAFKEAP
jgi:hypothetical protein